TRRVEAGLAVRAGVVRGEERSDNELARADRGDLVTDRFDDAAVLVSERGRAIDRLDAAVRPQVRAAHAGGGQPDDGVRRLKDDRVVEVLQADVAGSVENGCAHGTHPSSVSGPCRTGAAGLAVRRTRPNS